MFISCFAFLEHEQLKDEIPNSLSGLEKPWEKVFTGAGWCFINLHVPQSSLTSLLTKETFLCSPPIFLMAEVMDLDIPGPAACCDDEAVSFPVMPMLRLPPRVRRVGEPVPTVPGDVSHHKVSSSSVSTMLSLMPSLSHFLLVLPNLANLSPSLGRGVLGDISLRPPPFGLETLWSCSFELPHLINCNLGPVPRGAGHCCFGISPSVAVPGVLPCLKGNMGSFGYDPLILHVRGGGCCSPVQ